MTVQDKIKALNSKDNAANEIKDKKEINDFRTKRSRKYLKLYSKLNYCFNKYSAKKSRQRRIFRFNIRFFS